MVNSRYERAKYKYETVAIDDAILTELNDRLNERNDLILTATEDEITPFHLSWIRSFENLIQEIDPLGEIDTWSGDHSSSLVRQWHHAQYGGNYSAHDIETRKLSERYLEAQRFHAYLSVLLQLKRGKARVVKSKELFPANPEEAPTSDDVRSQTEPEKDKVFLVHGHDEHALATVARFISEIGFDPIILHEQSNAGDTIIEKLERHTRTGFAVVLYTDCDIGGSKKSPNTLMSRARQNVIFEHGYLVSKLGRANVCALVKGDIEIPSDLSGLIYISLDAMGGWKLAMAKELRSSGFKVDMNRVI